MIHQDQFTAIYKEQYAKIFRLCKGYFNGNEAIALDATQDVFVKVWQQMERFRHESSITTWIYRIAVNTCLLYLRKASTRKEKHTGIVPEMPFEAYDPIKEDQLKKMYHCIQQLSETDRLIILMVLDAVEYTAIANIIGITESNLRVKIHRIKNNLTNCVKK